MDYTRCRTDLPILLLYNLDPDWSSEIIDSASQLAHNLCEELNSLGHPVELVFVRDADIDYLCGKYSPEDYIIFNWCEDFPGEPNSYPRVARRLEEMGYVFTGADSLALEVSADKRRVKKLLNDYRLPTPVWDVYDTAHPNGWDIYPAIVKPALEHCSYGITPEALVWSTEGLMKRVRYVQEIFSQPAIVEEFIDGREFHVTVIGNGELRVLPIAEMDFSAFSQPENRLCTFESKFDPSSPAYNLIELKLPASLTPEQQVALEKVSRDAYRAANCRDYARMDIRLRDDTFFVLDVNPNADFSPDTSTVLAAESDGLPYSRLGSLLVNLAAQRHAGFREDGYKPG